MATYTKRKVDALRRCVDIAECWKGGTTDGGVQLDATGLLCRMVKSPAENGCFDHPALDREMSPPHHPTIKRRATLIIKCTSPHRVSTQSTTKSHASTKTWRSTAAPCANPHRSTAASARGSTSTPNRNRAISTGSSGRCPCGCRHSHSSSLRVAVGPLCGNVVQHREEALPEVGQWGLSRPPLRAGHGGLQGLAVRFGLRCEGVQHLFDPYTASSTALWITQIPLHKAKQLASLVKW